MSGRKQKEKERERWIRCLAVFPKLHEVMHRGVKRIRIRDLFH